MASSLFAPSVKATTKTPLPAYPLIEEPIETSFDKAFPNITISKDDQAGRPLPSLSALHVYCSEIPFVDKIEAMIGLAPAVTVPISLLDAGKKIQVEIAGLKPGVEYHFSARVVT